MLTCQIIKREIEEKYKDQQLFKQHLNEITSRIADLVSFVSASSKPNAALVNMDYIKVAYFKADESAKLLKLLQDIRASSIARYKNELTLELARAIETLFTKVEVKRNDDYKGAIEALRKMGKLSDRPEFNKEVPKIPAIKAACTTRLKMILVHYFDILNLQPSLLVEAEEIIFSKLLPEVAQIFNRLWFNAASAPYELRTVLGPLSNTENEGANFSAPLYLRGVSDSKGAQAPWSLKSSKVDAGEENIDTKQQSFGQTGVVFSLSNVS